MMKKSTRRVATSHLNGLIAGLIVTCAAATSALAQESACKPSKIDLGDGKFIESNCEPLKIAFLTAATNNTHLQAGIKGAQDAAKEIGATLDVFDPNWSPTVQYNQAQNVISSGKYNAIVAEMNDGNQACKILTEDAPKAGVLVAVANLPLCNRASNEGDELWSPGTLNFVGGSQGREAFRSWIMSIAEANPGPQKVAVLTGPDLNANTINTELALKDVQEKYPDFKVGAVVKTDYSVLQGNQKTLPLFQANPDLTIFISNYSDMTRGAVQAARQVGLNRKMKIYDNGGNIWSFQAVREDLIDSTRTLLPYTEMYEAVKALGQAWKGEKTPRFVPLAAYNIDKETVAKYEPQY
ncbi:sugar ABC transporter substrate-binding protein [Mesorhizobium sp. CCNWLW179-1]